MSHAKSKAAASLKLLAWNSGRKSILNSLLDEIENKTRKKPLNTLMAISETTNLADLSSVGFIGWRHTQPDMQGLCVYISKELQHYTRIKQTRYTLNGAIDLPAVDGKTPISVGFIASYRSPSLTKSSEHEEYLEDLARVLDEQLAEHENCYLLGDLNMFDLRYEVIDGKFVPKTPKTSPQTNVYHMFHKMLPTENYRHLFMGAPTHTPYQKDAVTCAQLDYMIQFHHGKFPGGKTKLRPTQSDHMALVYNFNVAFAKTVEVKFQSFDNRKDSDFEMLDELLLRETTASWDKHAKDGKAEFFFEYLQVLRTDLLGSLSERKTVRKPKGRDISVKIQLRKTTPI